jgi:hypothetical protein
MRIIVSFILFISLHLAASATETYNIIHVKGVIKVQKTGIVLKAGDKILSSDKVVFVTPDAIAAVISASQGRFVLKANPGAGQNGSGFIAMVESSVTPMRTQLSTRSGGLMTSIDISNHFSGESYAVLDSSAVSISSEAFPMNDNSFFYVRYTYLGQQINKKLPYQGDKLLLNKNVIFMVDNLPVNPADCQDFTLYYYNKAQSKSVSICSVSFVFPDMKELNADTKNMIKLLRDQKMSEEEIKSELKSFVYEFYGKTSTDNFDQWYNALVK